MICEDCRIGGQVLRRLVNGQVETSNFAAMGLVKNHHNACRGGTWCDCAHSLDPDSINWKRVHESK